MSFARNVLARTLVVLALSAAVAGLGTWWASLLVIQAAGELNALVHVAAARQITAEIDRVAPGKGQVAKAQQAIAAALRDPAVTDALASSIPNGSRALTVELAHLDAGLGPLLAKRSLVVNAGDHASALLAARLRSVARAAAVAAGALAATALAVSPLRLRVLRHLALGAVGVGGLTALGAWGLPALVSRFTHGGVRHVALAVLSGADPVRPVLLVSLLAGAGIYLLGHLAELVGGSRLARGGSGAPLAGGRVV